MNQFKKTSKTKSGDLNSSSQFSNDEGYLEKMQPHLFDMQKMFNVASSSSNDGMLCFKHISQEMEKKIGYLQKAIEQKKFTISTQKQNVREMIDQKNTMLCEFHEKFRKFTQKTEYENKMEEEIENLVKFLDELMPLNEEIRKVKTAESNIRNYIIDKFQIICTELEPIKDAYENDVKHLQDKVRELEDQENQWISCDKLSSDINHLIRLHQEKLYHLECSIKNEVVDCKQLKIEGEQIKNQTKIEILERQQALKNDAIKIQQAFYSLKNLFAELEGNRNKELHIKEQIEKFQKKLSVENQAVLEIERKIENAESEKEKLQKEINSNLLTLQNIENEKTLLINKQENLNNSCTAYEEEIINEEDLLNNLLNEKQSNEEKINQVMMEIENLKEKLSIKNSFSEESARNEILKKEIIDLNDKKNTLKENFLDLKNKLDNKKQEINQLKGEILSKDIFINDNDSDKNLLNEYLIVEKEQHVVSELIEAELENLFDKICDEQPYVETLETTLEKYNAEAYALDQEICKKDKILKQIISDAKICENSIHTLKQNVYQGKYITRQDLNKQVNAIKINVKTEQTIVEKLKEEIGALETVELRRKRPLLAPERKRNLSSAKTIKLKKDTIAKTTKNNANEIDVLSPNGDIYDFK